MDIKIISEERKIIEVPAGTLVQYRDVGVQVNCDLNESEFHEQPYVSVNTEKLPDRFLYGDNNGYPIIAVHLNDAVLFDDEGSGNTAPHVP